MSARRPTVVIGVVMLAAAVAQAFGRFTYSVMLPAMQRDLEISYTLAGALGTANLIAYLVGTALVSLAVTRLPVVRIVQFSLVASTLGLAALAFGESLAPVWLGMVVTGLAGAGIWVPSPGLAAAVADERRRAFAIGMVGTGIGIGLVFASAWASRLADAQWRTIYRIETAIAVVAVVAAVIVLREVGDVRAARPKISAIRSVPGWPLLLAIYTTFGLSMSLFVNFLTAMLRDDGGWSPSRAAAAFSLMGLATVFGGPVFGPLADRIGRAPAMALGLAAMAAFSVTVLVGSEAVVAIGVVGFGLAFAGVPTALAARITDHVDMQSFGAAFGIATLAFGLAQIFGPQVGGIIRDAAGTFQPVFFASAALALGGSALAVRLRRSR